MAATVIPNWPPKHLSNNRIPKLICTWHQWAPVHLLLSGADKTILKGYRRGEMVCIGPIILMSIQRSTQSRITFEWIFFARTIKKHTTRLNRLVALKVVNMQCVPNPTTLTTSKISNPALIRKSSICHKWLNLPYKLEPRVVYSAIILVYANPRDEVP